MTVEYEPFSPRWRSNPFPVYRELRERDPVHWAPEAQCWCVSRYEDVLFVLKHPELFSSRAMFTVLMNGGREEPPKLGWAGIRFLLRYALAVRLNPLGFVKARQLIALDPPEHGPLRNIVNRGFTPRQVAAWEPRIREIVSQQMARVRAIDDVDVVRDPAILVPVTVISSVGATASSRRRRASGSPTWSW
jgi:cytochrome P450